MGATSLEHSASRATPGARGRIFGSPVRTFIFIFLLSFAVRAALLAVWVSNHADFYRIGGEIGRVALSLTRTGQFADPYMIPTGPTAHPTPLSPALLALIYHLFGMTATAGYVRALVGIGSHPARDISSRLLLRQLRGALPGALLSVNVRAGLSADQHLHYADTQACEHQSQREDPVWSKNSADVHRL